MKDFSEASIAELFARLSVAPEQDETLAPLNYRRWGTLYPATSAAHRRDAARISSRTDSDP